MDYTLGRVAAEVTDKTLDNTPRSVHHTLPKLCVTQHNNDLTMLERDMGCDSF